MLQFDRVLSSRLSSATSHHNRQLLVPKGTNREHDLSTEHPPGTRISVGIGQLTSAEPPCAAVRRPEAYCLRIVAAPFREANAVP